MSSNVFHNKEFRKALKIFAVVQFAIALLILFFVYIEYLNIQKEISYRYAAITGKILETYPELEPDIIEILSRKENVNEVKMGKEILSKYGYFSSSIINHPFIKFVASEKIISAAVIIILYFTSTLAVLILGYTIIYKKVSSISKASEQVVDGTYRIYLPDDEEGEIGILEHRFNQMYERVNRGISSLESEKRFLREIISDISHQLKTPITTLLINHELMLNEEKMDEEEQSNFLVRNQEQLKRMEWLTQSLLKLARLEAGSIVFKLEKRSVVDIVMDAVGALSEMAELKKLSVEIEKPSLAPDFYGDAEWLTEALINIIKNAYEHSNDDGGVQIRILKTTMSFSIVISDNGTGISEKDIPYVFKRFYKTGTSVKQNSVGIGLALSKSIIEGQGGSISVKSTVGVGSEFTVTFLTTIGSQ